MHNYISLKLIVIISSSLSDSDNILRRPFKRPRNVTYCKGCSKAFTQIKNHLKAPGNIKCRNAYTDKEFDDLMKQLDIQGKDTHYQDMKNIRRKSSSADGKLQIRVSLKHI